MSTAAGAEMLYETECPKDCLEAGTCHIGTEAAIKHHVSKSSALDAMGARMEEISACFLLGFLPEEGEMLNIRIDVRRDGTIARAKVELGPRVPRATVDCLERVLGRLSFPMHCGDDPSRVDLPFSGIRNETTTVAELRRSREQNLEARARLEAMADRCAPARASLPAKLPSFLAKPANELHRGIACALRWMSDVEGAGQFRDARCPKLERRERQLAASERLALLERRAKLIAALPSPLDADLVVEAASSLGLADEIPAGEDAVRWWTFWYGLMSDGAGFDPKVRGTFVLRLVPRWRRSSPTLPAAKVVGSTKEGRLTFSLVDPLGDAGGFAKRPASEREALIRWAGQSMAESMLRDVLIRPDITPEPELRELVAAELRRVMEISESIRDPVCP